MCDTSGSSRSLQGEKRTCTTMTLTMNAPMMWLWLMLTVPRLTGPAAGLSRPTTS